MNKSKIFKLLALFFLVTLFVPLMFYANSEAQNFKLVTDVLDEFGGRASSTNYSLRVSTGGQPSAVGKMNSTNFEDRSGYAHSAWVWHGDVNGDGTIDLSDVMNVAKYLFGLLPPPRPMEAGDVDCNNKIQLGDAIYLFNFLFKGGPPLCNL